MIPETASPLEIGWTVIAVLAVLVCGWVVADARKDLTTLRRQPDSVLQVLAWANLIKASGIVVALAIMASIGIRAMLLPSPTPTGDPDAGANLSAVGLIVIELILAGISGLLAWTRHRVRTLYECEARTWDHVERRDLP